MAHKMHLVRRRMLTSLQGLLVQEMNSEWHSMLFINILHTYYFFKIMIYGSHWSTSDKAQKSDIATTV